MKKALLLMGITVGLGACGNDDTDAVEEPSEDVMADEEEQQETGDPLKFIESEGDLILRDGANEYGMKHIYTSDETNEDGFTTYEDGNFEMKYAIVHVQNSPSADQKEGDEKLLFIGEVDNGTKDNYYFNERILVKTDEKEKSEVEFGLNGAGDSDQRSKFIDNIPLEYDIPEKFTLEMLDPSIQGDLDDAVFGDDWDRPFDEAFEEFKKENTVQQLEFHKE